MEANPEVPAMDPISTKTKPFEPPKPTPAEARPTEAKLDPLAGVPVTKVPTGGLPNTSAAGGDKPWTPISK